MSDEIQTALESKFLSPKQVAKELESNEEVKAIMDRYGSLAEKVLPTQLAELVNVTYISQLDEQGYESYKSSDELIKASNQNFWASIALQEFRYSPDWEEDVRKIAVIMYNIEPITPTEEESQRLTKLSVKLADKAVKAEDFKDENIQYIVSSYVHGEGKQPLLVRFMNNMIETKGVYSAMDFFDEYLIDGMLDHPFYYPYVSFTDPYAVKRDLFLRLHEKYGGRPFHNPETTTSELLMRVDKTFANFSLRAIVGKKHLQGYNTRCPLDDAWACCYDIKVLTGKHGEELGSYLRELGFEEQIIKAYLENVSESYIRWSTSFETALKSANRIDLGQTRESLLRPPEINEALEVFGFSELPSKLELKRKYYEMMMIYHPDKSGLPNAEEKATDISIAYKILTDYIKTN